MNNQQNCIINVENPAAAERRAFLQRTGVEGAFPMPPLMVSFQTYHLPEVGDELELNYAGRTVSVRVTKRRFIVQDHGTADATLVKLEGQNL